MVSRETLREWRAGFSDAWTVGLGLVPLGLAFGLLITQSGFSWWWAPILSLVIYAGSMEFLAIGMITAGVGIIPAAVTGFMVNFRHIFYGLTFPRHLIRNFWARAYSTYALTDESYAIVSARAAAGDGHRMRGNLSHPTEMSRFPSAPDCSPLLSHYCCLTTCWCSLWCAISVCFLSAFSPRVSTPYSTPT